MDHHDNEEEEEERRRGGGEEGAERGGGKFNCSQYLTPSRPLRSYQGETQVIKLIVKVRFTVRITGHFIFEED